MQINCRKAVWELDPQWIHVDLLDEAGNPIGFTYFEINPGFRPNPPTSLATVAMAWIKGIYRMFAGPSWHGN